MGIPLVALSHGRSYQRTSHGEGTVGHGDVARGGNAVSVAAVDDGGRLGTVGSVLGDGLSDDAGGDSGSGQGRESSSDGEAHFDRGGWDSRNVPLEGWLKGCFNECTRWRTGGVRLVRECAV